MLQRADRRSLSEAPYWGYNRRLRRGIFSVKEKVFPNRSDKHVGTRVSMRRMMLNMSQSDLGEALGISFQQIQKI
jgi:hypothetical protein